MLTRQKQAIHDAGELALIEMVPILVLYMDYPKSQASALVVTANSFSLSGRRRDWPALDAIMKIGHAATPSLEKIAQDKNEELRERLSALRVLHYIDDKRAAIVGEMMKQEFEKADDKDAILRVESVLNDSMQVRKSKFPPRAAGYVK